MDASSVPTKGNLMKAQSSLELSKQGYDLMDRKRNILVRELLQYIDEARAIQSEIDERFGKAYRILQRANMEMGRSMVASAAASVPEEESVTVKLRSVMGTEMPLVIYDKDKPVKPTYSLYGTRASIDMARLAFEDVKDLIIKLTTVEISAYRLASNIKSTQKRANALKNITIPRYETLVKEISDALEENEREEFTRLKVVKKNLNS